MISIMELRIGNLVNYDEDGTAFLITEISHSGLGVKNEVEENWIEIDQFSPIALTPEILEKFGFELIYGGQLPDFIERNGFMMFWYEGKLSANFGHFADLSREIGYVHQLQNLYFALVGKDLQDNDNHNYLKPSYEE